MHVHTLRMSIVVPPATNLGGTIWVCSWSIERMRDRTGTVRSEGGYELLGGEGLNTTHNMFHDMFVH